MTASDVRLDAAVRGLAPVLQTLVPGLTVQLLATVDSTNTRLVERLRQPDAAPALLVAEAQTQGRGRQGRAWQSAVGDSLTFSLGLPMAPADWSGLSLAVGVALADAIEPLASGQMPRLQLKWPNDLWLADEPGRWRKLGGILIETVTSVSQRACVVGIGLNVRPRPQLPDPSGLTSGYACVQELHPALDAADLLTQVVPAVVSALQTFERDGLAPFVSAFARRDLLCGQAVDTTRVDLPHGVAEGIDAQGALRVRHAGQLVSVSSGEVSVRPRALVPSEVP